MKQLVFDNGVLGVAVICDTIPDSIDTVTEALTAAGYDIMTDEGREDAWQRKLPGVYKSTCPDMYKADDGKWHYGDQHPYYTVDYLRYKLERVVTV